MDRAAVRALVIGALAAIWATDSSAFPELIRHGYDSCTTCHVSPAGGGALTPYGRGISEAVLSTWANEGEGNPGHGALPPPPDWLMVGGDIRSVEVATKTDDAQTYTFVPMQADAELAVKIPQLPGITVDASVGEYGPDRQVQYRRNYIKADVDKHLSLRVGHFTPAFGVNLPDHTTLTRESMGLGEGSESNNAEVAWVAPGGEMIGTFIYGASTTVTADPATGYNAPPADAMTGAAMRDAVYLGSSTQVGVSYLGISNFTQWRQAYGAFVQSGIMTRAYVLAEYDRKYETGKTSDLGLLKFGYEVHQGVMATLQADSDGEEKEGRVGLQWWPRPHLEFLIEERRSFQSIGAIDSGVLMLHYYL